MPDLLTSAEVEEIARGQRGTDHQRLAEQHIALATRLADSPCPVCKVVTSTRELNLPGSIYTEAGIEPCPNCGDFPPDRRGRFAETWQEACDSLGKSDSP